MVFRQRAQRPGRTWRYRWMKTQLSWMPPPPSGFGVDYQSRFSLCCARCRSPAPRRPHCRYSQARRCKMYNTPLSDVRAASAFAKDIFASLQAPVWKKRVVVAEGNFREFKFRNSEDILTGGLDV